MMTIYRKYRFILWVVLITFFINTVVSQPVQADVPFLPKPGQMVPLTASFSQPTIMGLRVFPHNPFKFEFVMSKGDEASGNTQNALAQQAFLKEEANKLVKYFLASLTIPEKDLWVNLSPYERSRIIPAEFGITEMGKELLAQDYLLKQVTASVMYPEGEVGREFWKKIYQGAYERFGTTNVAVDTFNKVWIVPDKAVVYENALNNTVVITDSTLKVMLEEDYLAMSRHAEPRLGGAKNLNVTLRSFAGAQDDKSRRQLSNQMIRQLIIPLLNKEVNTGKNFAVLRQVYHSLILALWYKHKLKQSLIAQGYVDRKKTGSIDVTDKNVNQEIYAQYLKSYKKGVYNYIKEETTWDNQVIPRKYFSGGVNWAQVSIQKLSGPDAAMRASARLQRFLAGGLFLVVAGFGMFGPQIFSREHASPSSSISGPVATATAAASSKNFVDLTGYNSPALKLPVPSLTTTSTMTAPAAASVPTFVHQESNKSSTDNVRKVPLAKKEGFNSVSSILRRELGIKITRSNIDEILKSYKVSIEDKDGNDIPNPDYTHLKAGWKVVFNLTPNVAPAPSTTVSSGTGAAAVAQAVVDSISAASAPSLPTLPTSSTSSTGVALPLEVPQEAVPAAHLEEPAAKPTASSTTAKALLKAKQWLAATENANQEAINSQNKPIEKSNIPDAFLIPLIRNHVVRQSSNTQVVLESILQKDEVATIIEQAGGGPDDVYNILNILELSSRAYRVTQAASDLAKAELQVARLAAEGTAPPSITPAPTAPVAPLEASAKPTASSTTAKALLKAKQWLAATENAYQKAIKSHNEPIEKSKIPKAILSRLIIDRVVRQSSETQVVLESILDKDKVEKIVREAGGSLDDVYNILNILELSSRDYRIKQAASDLAKAELQVALLAAEGTAPSSVRLTASTSSTATVAQAIGEAVVTSTVAGPEILPYPNFTSPAISVPEPYSVPADLLAQALKQAPQTTRDLRTLTRRGQEILDYYKTHKAISDQDRIALEREVGKSRRYDILQDRFNTGPLELQPYRGVYSVDPGEEYKIVKEFKDWDEFTDFLFRSHLTRIRFFKIKVRRQGPLDISKLSDLTVDPTEFEEVTSPKEVKKMTDDSLFYLTYIEGMDSQGNAVKGVLAGGVRSAYEKVSFMQALVDAFDFWKEVNTKISNPKAFDKNGHLIIGSYVQREQHGLPLKDRIKYITSENIEERVEEMPDGNKRAVIYYLPDGPGSKKKIPLKSYVFGTSPYAEFSLMEEQEQATLTDKDNSLAYKMAFDSDHYSKKDPLMRGEIILGHNWKYTEELKLRLMRTAADENDELVRASLKYDEGLSIMHMALAPANVGFGALNDILLPGVPIPNPINPGADLLYRALFYNQNPVKPVGKTLMGAPSMDRIVETEAGPWLLRKQRPDLHLKDHTEAENAWAKLTPQEKLKYKAEAAALIAAGLPGGNAQDFFDYLQRREKDAKVSYFLAIGADVSVIAGTFEGALDTRWAADTLKTKDGNINMYKVPNAQWLAFTLQNIVPWALTQTLPLPQAVAAAVGSPLQYVPVTQLAHLTPDAYNIASAATSYVTPGIIDLRSLVNSIALATGLAENPTDLPFPNSPQNLRVGNQVLGVDVKEILHVFGILERDQRQLINIYEGNIHENDIEAIGPHGKQILALLKQGLIDNVPANMDMSDFIEIDAQGNISYIVNGIKGTILDPFNNDSVWKRISSTVIRLKPDVNLTQEQVKAIAGSGSEKIWPMVQKAQTKNKELVYLKNPDVDVETLKQAIDGVIKQVGGSLEEAVQLKLLLVPADASLTQDYIFSSKMVPITEDGMETLFFQGVNHVIPLQYEIHGVNVPIYLVANPDHPKDLQVVVLTKRGIDAKLKPIERANKSASVWMKMHQEGVGGVSISRGLPGGILGQPTQNGLRVSYDDPRHSDQAYVIDSLQSNYYFMLSGQREVAERTLEFFMKPYYVQMGYANRDGVYDTYFGGHHFEGFPEMLLATKGTNQQANPDPIAMAGFVLQLINYRDYYHIDQDKHLDEMIQVAADWLVDHQEDGGFVKDKAKPIAAAAWGYAALARSGHEGKAEKALAFAKSNMDPLTGLLFDITGAQHRHLSADATLTWFAALGPQDTLKLLYDNDTAKYVKAWKNLMDKFELKEGIVDTVFTGKKLVLMDLLDANGARDRREKGMRIGDTRLTASTIGRLREHLPLLESLGERWMAPEIAKLTQGLNDIQAGKDSLPASTLPGGDTGAWPNYDYPKGRAALGPLTEKKLSVDAPVVINPWRGLPSGQKLPPIPMPKQVLRQEDRTTTFVPGEKAIQEVEDLESDFVQREALREIKKERKLTSKEEKDLQALEVKLGSIPLGWANIEGHNELGLTTPKGVAEFRRIHPSHQRLLHAKSLAVRELRDAQDYSLARAGQRAFVDGAVVFSNFTRMPDGRLALGTPIRDSRTGGIFRGPEWNNKVMKLVHDDLPVVERARISRVKKYANFVLKLNVGTVNKPNVREVMVTRIFPSHKDIIDTMNSDFGIDVYRNGLLILQITPDRVVVPLNDSKLGLAPYSIILDNPSPYTTRPSDQDLPAYVAQVKEAAAQRLAQLPIVGLTALHTYHYVDPRQEEVMDPDVVRSRFVVVDHINGIAMESYGLYPGYVDRVTEKDVAHATRDKKTGYIIGEKTRNNGDEDLPAATALTTADSIEREANPKPGRLNGDNTITLSKDHRTSTVQHYDPIHKTHEKMVVDNVHDGHMIRMHTDDPLVNEGTALYAPDDFTAESLEAFIQALTARGIAIPEDAGIKYINEHVLTQKDLRKFFPAIVNEEEAQQIENLDTKTPQGLGALITKNRNIINKGEPQKSPPGRSGQRQTFGQDINFEWSHSHYLGGVPVKTYAKSSATGRPLTTVTQYTFDPDTRRMTAEGTDHTNGDQQSTYTWDWRWEDPVHIRSVDSRGHPTDTTVHMNRNNTHKTSTQTTGDQEGAINVTGDYSPGSMRWVMDTTQWVDHTDGIQLTRATRYYTPHGREIFSTIPSNDGLDAKYANRYDVDGVANGGESYLFNFVMGQWVPQFGYRDFTRKDGLLHRTKEDFAHPSPSHPGPKTSTEEIDLTTGVLLGEQAPEAMHKNEFGRTMEGPVNATYVYDGRSFLAPGHVTVSSAEGQETKTLDGTSKRQEADGKTYYYLTWQVQSPDHKISYEDVDLSDRGKKAQARYYFDPQDRNVEKERGVSEHIIDNHFGPLTVSNTLDIDSTPGSLAHNLSGGWPKNYIHVLGEFDSSRIQGTENISIDQEHSTDKETVVKQEILADNQVPAEGKVFKTIRYGYQYGTDRLNWMEVEGKRRVEFHWNNPSPPLKSFIEHGIADGMDAYEIDKDGNKIRHLSHSKVTAYDEKTGTVTMEVTNYKNGFGPAFPETMTMRANGDPQTIIAELMNPHHEKDLKYGYFLYASDKDKYIDLSTTKDLGRYNLITDSKPLDASHKDYLYAFADSPNPDAYDNLEFIVTDAHGRTVTFDPKIEKRGEYLEKIQEAESRAKRWLRKRLNEARSWVDLSPNGARSLDIKELPFVFPYKFSPIQVPSERYPHRESTAVVNLRSLQGRNPYVMPVQWIADAGLDVTQLQTIEVHYKGDPRLAPKVSELKYTAALDGVVITPRSEPQRLLSELEKYIANARIIFGSNDTVFVDMGWDTSLEQRDRVWYQIKGDGQVLASDYQRNEDPKLNRWTPIRTVFDEDVVLGMEAPEANIYIGYPLTTVAEEVKVIHRDGEPVALELSNGRGTPKEKRFQLGQTGDAPYLTVYYGPDSRIVVPGEYRSGVIGWFDRRQGNNIFSSLLRDNIHALDTDHQSETRKEFDKMERKQETGRHPVEQFSRETPPWRRVPTMSPIPIPSTVSLRETVLALRHAHTGLFTDNKGDLNVDVSRLGDALVELIESGNPEDIKLVEEVLLNYTRDKPFSIYAITRGGQVSEIHDFIDPDSGQPLYQTPQLVEPKISSLNAGGVVSMANASFRLWQKTGNPHARTLAVGLANVLMDKFYYSADKDNQPSEPGVGVFSELENVTKKTWFGIPWIGKPANYEVETNSKIFLLFTQMLKDTTLDPSFKDALQDKIDAWKKFDDKHIKPRIEAATPIVPHSFYRSIQANTENKYRLFGENLNSSAETWLYFIEAGLDRGTIKKEQAKGLLDMLARSHGVWVGSYWGVDNLSSPRQRAIVPAVTIEMLRVARLVGYEELANFMENNIVHYPRTMDNLFPILIGIDPITVDPEQGLDRGERDVRYFPVNDEHGQRVWPGSIAASAALLRLQKGFNSVYSFPMDRAQIADNFETPFVPSVLPVLLSYLPLIWFFVMPFFNWGRGALSKWWLSKKLKAKIPDFNGKHLESAFEAITQAIERTQNQVQLSEEEKKRVHVLRGRTLDIMAAQGFPAYIALLKYIQEKHPGFVQDDDIKIIIETQADFFNKELEKQADAWSKKPGSIKQFLRVLGLRRNKSNNEQGWYTNPRAHIVTLFNLYMWDQVKELRQKLVDQEASKDEKSKEVLKGSIGRSIDLLKKEPENFKEWAKLKAKESRHPFVIGLGIKLFPIFPIFMAAGFTRAALMPLQQATSDFIHHYGLSGITNLVASFPLLSAFVAFLPLLAVFTIENKKARIASFLAGIGLSVMWLLGMVANAKLDFLFTETIASSTFTQPIIDTFVNQIGNHAFLFVSGAGSLVLSFMAGLKRSEEQFWRWTRRVLGGFGAGAMAVSLALGLGPIVKDPSTALVMYSAIMALGLEALVHFWTAHSWIGTSLKYYHAKQYHFEGMRAYTVYFLNKAIYFFTGLLTLLAIFPNIESKFSSGNWTQMTVGFLQVIATFILSHFAILLLEVVTLGGFSYALPKYIYNHFGALEKWPWILRIVNKIGLLPALFEKVKSKVSGIIPKTIIKAPLFENTKPLDAKKLFEFLKKLILHRDKEQEKMAEKLKNYLNIQLGMTFKEEDFTDANVIVPLLTKLENYEQDAKCPTTGRRVVWVVREEDITEQEEKGYTPDDIKELKAAFRIREYIQLYTGGKNTTSEVYVFLTSLAKQLGKRAQNVQLLLISNNIYGNLDWTVENSEIKEAAPLVPDILDKLLEDEVIKKVDGPFAGTQVRINKNLKLIMKSVEKATKDPDVQNKIRGIFEASLARQGRRNDEFEFKLRMVFLWDELTERTKSRYQSQVIINETPLSNKIGSESNAIPYLMPNAKQQFILDRQVVSHYAKEIDRVLTQFGERHGREISASWPTNRRPVPVPQGFGEATTIQKVAEESFGAFVVGAEAVMETGPAAYGWGGVVTSDYNPSIVKFFKRGREEEPLSPYQSDLISEDIALALVGAINAIIDGYIPKGGLSEIYAIKIREWVIDQLWGSWIRWAGGWPQLSWNPVMQERFIFGPLPLSQREYRMWIAGLFSLAPLAGLYRLLLPYTIIFGATFFVGINAAFFDWGFAQSIISIFGSYMMRVLNQGFWSGSGKWWRDRPRDTLSFGGTQGGVHESGVLRAMFLGVSSYFNLMAAPGENEESHMVHLGWVRNKSGKLERSSKFTWDQTYQWHLIKGFIEVSGYLIAFGILDILNVGLLYIPYIIAASALLSIFLYHEKIGKPTPKRETAATIIAPIMTAATLFFIYAGINPLGQVWWSIAAGVWFAIISVGSVFYHSKILKKKPEEKESESEWRRFLSTLSRWSWASFFIMLPLAAVKIAGIIFGEVGDRTTVVPFKTVGEYFAIAAIVPVVLIIGGWISDKINRKNIDNGYIKINDALAKAKEEGKLTPEAIEEVTQKLQEYESQGYGKSWLEIKKIRRDINEILDRAMISRHVIRTQPAIPHNRLNNNTGGIDLSQTSVGVRSSAAGRIQTAFDDPVVLRLLLNSDGLAPIVYDVQEMTPAMVNHFVGLN